MELKLLKNIYWNVYDSLRDILLPVQYNLFDNSEYLPNSSGLLCLIYMAREWDRLRSYCLGKHSEEDE